MTVRSNYVANATAQFRILSQDQVEEIHAGTMEVLQRTGVEVHHPEALDLLKRAGCHVDGPRVRIPSWLVERSIRSAPSRVVLCGRDGSRRLFLENRNFHFGPGVTNPFISDPVTGERRLVTHGDVANTARLVDSLPNLDFVMSLAMISDVTKGLADVYEVEAMLSNTTKPIVSWGFGVEGYRDIVDMCIAVAGGLEALQKNPFICLYSEPTTPLQHSFEAMGKLLFMAEHNLPCIYTPAPMAGATAPATLAGVLVMGNAECLTGVVVSQLKREGAPIIMGGVLTVMDMRSTLFSYGAPEMPLQSAAMVDVAHYYKIPSFSTAGCTDAKTLDLQAASELTFSVLSAALSGANLIHDVGFLEYGSSGSYEMLLLGDEVIGMAKRLVRGIEVTRDTMALDIIDDVGPAGHFLTQAHTFRHFRDQLWTPRYFDRNRYDLWKAEGQIDMGQRLRDEANRLMREHSVEPLDKKVVEGIERVLARAEARVRG
ncbi:MAG: trimethylamine methyltransferase family protein [Bacillota bacterium]|jgi:trimethylamine--corrinoid protein Co-methyltransferase